MDCHVIGAEVKGIASNIVGRGRRMAVDEFNGVQGMKDVFAIGDISLNTTDTRYPGGHPQVAQVAIQQGKLLAENFLSARQNRQWKPFRYNDKGSLAIISKYRAVADLPKVFLKGFPAWIIWLFIHLIPIAGFRNKVSLALSWAWAMITNDPTLRLIIRPDKKEFESEREPEEELNTVS
jgi:NADH:ubiquinone reductase (H+-translocating)